MKFQITCRYKNGEPVNTPELELVEKFLDWQGQNYTHKEGDSLYIYKDGVKHDGFVSLVAWFDNNGFLLL